MRRPSSERIAELEQKAARLRADSERRLSVASDGTCALMYDAEKALRALGAYCGPERGASYLGAAEALAEDRREQWAKIKEIRNAAGKS